MTYYNNSCSVKCYKEHVKFHENFPEEKSKEEFVDEDDESEELELSDDDIILCNKDYEKICIDWLTK